MYYYIRNYYLSTSIYEHFTLTNVSNRYMLKAGTPPRGVPAAACAAQSDPPADPVAWPAAASMIRPTLINTCKGKL